MRISKIETIRIFNTLCFVMPKHFNCLMKKSVRSDPPVIMHHTTTEYVYVQRWKRIDVRTEV